MLRRPHLHHCGQSSYNLFLLPWLGTGDMPLLSSKAYCGTAVFMVPRCSAALEHSDIHRFAAPADFEKYDRFLLKQAMEGAGGTYKSCAYARCESGGWYDLATTSFVDCAGCGRRTCVDCDTTPYHSGQPCPNSPQAKKKRQEDEDATMALVERISKPCPNEECGARIEKKDGCDHMTCTRLPCRLCVFPIADTFLACHRQEVPPRVLLVMLGAVRTDSNPWQF
jgi:hypothetical protein